jgi:signal transduction histidine kinase
MIVATIPRRGRILEFTPPSLNAHQIVKRPDDADWIAAPSPDHNRQDHLVLTDELKDLSPHATLADLPSTDVEVNANSPGSIVAAALERGYDVPGVIVRLEPGRAAVISSQTFFHRMSRQFSREVFLLRPIRVFCDYAAGQALRLPATMPIGDAAGRALGRSATDVYEPILVDFGEDQLRLLDMHVLLLAQARLLAMAQEAVVQSEKLAGLGQLAAGVAHEINNPLAFVLNNVALLQRDVRALQGMLALYDRGRPLIEQHDQPLAAELSDFAEQFDLPYTMTNMQDVLKRSKDGLKRIETIVRDLRDFARLDESDYHEVDLNAGIASTANIVATRAKSRDIRIVLDLDPLPPVACFPAKINQVVMNLLTNAIDASPAGGIVTVQSESNGDGEVTIAVIDRGHGIPEPVRKRIFDPFFTTKPPGAGTGLGLSISYGIVRDHGGRIDFDATAGGGTTFRVTLPVHGRVRAVESSIR